MRFLDDLVDWNELQSELSLPRTYATFMMSLTVFFLFAAMNLLAPNLTQAGDDFGMDEKEKDEKLGGWLSLGFFIMGAPAALFCGYLCDQMKRTHLMGWVVILGSIANACTYWIVTFDELLICRIFSGIAIGGSIPVIYSMLGDLYPADRRNYPATIVGLFYSGGASVGQLFAGEVGGEDEYGWKAPFLMVAVPTIVIGAVFAFTVQEPRRGESELGIQDTSGLHENLSDGAIRGVEEGMDASQGHSSHSATKSALISLVDDEKDSNGESNNTDTNKSNDYKGKASFTKVANIFKTPSAVFGYLQGIPGCLPWGLIFAFLNDFYSDARGLSVEKATMILTVFGVGSLLGQLIGGLVGQKLYNMREIYQPILCSVTTSAGVLPMYYLLNITNFSASNMGFVAFVSFFTGVLVSITGPNIKVIMQNVTLPEVRGAAFAAFALTDDLGKGLGPFIVYYFILAYRGNRVEAYNLIISFWFICGLFLGIIAFFYKADIEKVNYAVKLTAMRGEQGRASSDVEAIAEQNGKKDKEGNGAINAIHQNFNEALIESEEGGPNTRKL